MYNAQTLTGKGEIMETLQSLRGWVVRMFVGMALGMLVYGGGARGDELLLSEAKELSNLDSAGIGIAKPKGMEEHGNVEQQKLQSLHRAVVTLTCGIDPAGCTLSQRRDGHDVLAVKGLAFLNDPGRPELPMKTVIATLPRDAEVMGIEIVGGSYREILNPVNLATTPQPRIWMRQQDIPEQVRQRLAMASLETAGQPISGYFPGEIATYSTGRDNDSTYVYVRVFPVQYSPQSNKAVLVTDVKINVHYSQSAGRQQAPAAAGAAKDTAECVIICPAALQSAAELLRDFHAEHEDVSTSIMTTEDISAAYIPAADPPYPGYSGNYSGKDKIVGYDYALAKKIICYLRDEQRHPNLKYVTLLGDGQLVPPSYYLNEWTAYTWYNSEYYYDWIPTDFLYSSPDYDFIPNYRVGRLPVSDAAQATSVVSKIERWHNALAWDWFKRVSVAGGRPFGTMWYYGELSLADLINNDTFNGMEIAKYYYTDGTFDVAHVKPLFVTQDTGVLYHIDHGSGHKLWVGGESISPTDIMISPTPRTPLFNPESPLVVSVSCINGAYDTDLTQFDYQPEFDAIPHPTSFGEAVVLSDAGGIAYVGGSRLNYAGWSMSYDQGRILAHHYYIEQLCNSAFESYHRGVNRIGDMTYNALKYYAQDNSMSSTAERETILGFVLLGDPVLSLPQQQSGARYQKPYLTAVDPDRYAVDGVPYYRDLPEDRSRKISVVSNSDSPAVNVKSIYTWDDVVVARGSLVPPPLTHSFTPEDCGYHLVRSTGEDGKEGWLYLNTQYVFIPASEMLLIDADDGEDYERYYTDALAHIGRTCDIWENGARDFIDLETLAQYEVTIWAIPFSYPSEWEKGVFRSYLDSGARLFITGQDIGFYLGWSSSKKDEFYEKYLHAGYVKDDGRSDTLSGVPGDPIGDGLTIGIDGGDGAGDQYWPDEIEPIAPAAPVFTYEPNREAALRVDTGVFRVVYFAFGFEGINSQRDRDEVMKRVIDWLLKRSPRGR